MRMHLQQHQLLDMVRSTRGDATDLTKKLTADVPAKKNTMPLTSKLTETQKLHRIGSASAGSPR